MSSRQTPTPKLSGTAASTVPRSKTLPPKKLRTSTQPNGKVVVYTVYPEGTGGGGNGGAPVTHASTVSTKHVAVANHPPTITVGSSQSFGERQYVNVFLTATDPDANDGVTFSQSGTLPLGLSFNGTSIGGTISADAVKLRTSWSQAAPSHTFAFTVTATDRHHAPTSKRLSWNVQDTYISMPNYFDKYGDGSDGPPNIGNTFKHAFDCAYDPAGNDQKVYYQSVRPADPVSWSTTITFLYGKNDPTCRHVSGHWPA